MSKISEYVNFTIYDYVSMSYYTRHLVLSVSNQVYECQQLAYDGSWEAFEKLLEQLSDTELNQFISVNSQNY